MAIQQAKRVAAVPATVEPNTMYLVATQQADVSDVYVSNAAGSAVKHVGLKKVMVNKKILVA